MAKTLVDRPMPQLRSSNPDDIKDYLRSLSDLLSEWMNSVADLQNNGKQPVLYVDVLDTEPLSPFDGMLVYADGTNWNPGAGVGFYGYENGSWVKL